MVHFRVARDDISRPLPASFLLSSWQKQRVNVAGGFASQAQHFEFVTGFTARQPMVMGWRHRTNRRGSRPHGMILKVNVRRSSIDAAGAEDRGRRVLAPGVARSFVFLPGADFGGVYERFAHAGFFEGGGD